MPIWWPDWLPGGHIHGSAGAGLEKVGRALLSREPERAGNWLSGAQGEKLTALPLWGISLLTGAHVYHNRRRPWQSADLDHTVFGTRGCYYFNSKMWARGSSFEMRGRWLYRENRPVDLSTTMIEALEIQAYVGVPLTAAVVVHGVPGIPLRGLHVQTTWGAPVLVVNWVGMVALILARNERLDPDEVEDYRLRFEEHFPGYGPIETPWYWRETL
jgi:hypothetical protein